MSMLRYKAKETLQVQLRVQNLTWGSYLGLSGWISF